MAYVCDKLLKNVVVVVVVVVVVGAFCHPVISAVCFPLSLERLSYV